MDRVDWTLVLAAIAAVTGLINTWSGFGRSRREKRAAAAMVGKRWSVRLRKAAAGRHLRATVSFDPGNGPSAQVTEVRVLAPRGATICGFREESDGPPDYHRRQEIPDGDQRYRVVRFGADLGGRAQTDKAGRMGSRNNEAEVLVQMPERPFWRRRPMTRLEFAVRFEERTASRDKGRVTVRSEEAPWRI